MSNQVAKVRRETIVACMACPLCNKLLRDATTISECLHTFCRRCIYKKILDEEVDCCPICNIDLGCVPIEKLRPDHNLQDVRTKIFPFKRRKVKVFETVPSVSFPVRRKERSLSSLVVSTPRLSPQTGMTGRRTKCSAKKAAALRISSFPTEISIKEEDSTECRPESSSSLELLSKFTQCLRQNSSMAESSVHVTPIRGLDNGSEPWDMKSDLWKPLNCLVEAANRTKPSSPQCSSAKLHVIDGDARKHKVKDHTQKRKNHDEKCINGSLSLELQKPKKLRRVRRKKVLADGVFAISPQTVLEAGVRCERRNRPIWFSLVASEDQQGDSPLPQLPSSYLRIKDGDVPVSFIQKYLTAKLGLVNESEVEIKCMGQEVYPDLEMHKLVDMWVQTSASIPHHRIPSSIGSSAKDFVMVLAYARRRKLPPPLSVLP